MRLWLEHCHSDEMEQTRRSRCRVLTVVTPDELVVGAMFSVVYRRLDKPWKHVQNAFEEQHGALVAIDGGGK